MLNKTTTMKSSKKLAKTPHDRYCFLFVPCQQELMRHLRKSAADYAKKNKLKKPNLSMNCRRLFAEALGLDATIFMHLTPKTKK